MSTLLGIFSLGISLLMFWFIAIVAFILLVLVIWLFFRTSELTDFMRILKISTAEASKGESFRPLESKGTVEVQHVVSHVNAIYAALKKYQPLSDENTVLKKEIGDLKESLVTYKSAVDYLHVIGELGQKISSTLSLQEVVENLCDSICSMMDSSVVEIGLYDKQTNRLKIFVTHSEDSHTGSKTKVIYSAAFADWCMENGKDIMLVDVEKNYSRYLYKLPYDTKTKFPQSLISCPIITDQKKKGVISVLSFQKNSFSSYHFDMIKSLIPYAALAIENAQGYEQLAIAQQQLVQQEKMASLGQLTAGVAHEINNPINFVSANITPLKRDIDEIMELLDKYSSLDESNYQSKLREILDFRNQINLSYTIEEINSLIRGIEEGSKRTAEIVRGLRNFSRLDEEDMKKANINEGISSTLLLLQNKLNQNNIHVIKSFGDIPEIECFPGQLNQVFMNVLSNAIDAIDENQTGKTGEQKISIATSKEIDHLRISIRDTGSGMSEEMQKKIYDPFYTTKDVGKGTGLGLSISYGIIEKHKGRIDVKSEVGKGTEFIIWLPLA